MYQYKYFVIYRCINTSIISISMYQYKYYNIDVSIQVFRYHAYGKSFPNLFVLDCKVFCVYRNWW